MVLNEEDIAKAHWVKMSSWQSLMAGLSTVNDVLRQLGSAKDVAGAEMQHKRLARSKQDFFDWMDKVCPSFQDALKEISEYCGNAIRDCEGASFTDTAGACPTAAFPLPKTELLNNLFIFR